MEAMKLWIGGAWREAAGRETFEDLNPLDDRRYAVAARGTAEDVDSAVHAARESFKTYGRSTPKDREAWLLKTADILAQRRQEIVDCLIDEIGSPIGKANFEFEKGLTMMRAAAGLTRQVRGETFQSDAPGTWSMSIRSPLGVVACITPFNVPFIKTSRMTGNALATGNTVVLLASEFAPRLAALVTEAYAEAGLPAGALNLVTGFGHEIGDRLTSHRDVDFVTFTGSSVVGQHIAEICARNRTPLTLELGGKSPTLILRDADLAAAVPMAVRSMFLYSGQACIASSRFYVEKPLYDAFTETFAAAAGRLGMGDLRDPSTVIGPIISVRQRDRVKAHISDAVSKGATLLAGGDWDGNRCRPTVLCGVKTSMAVCKEETFGPVTSLYPVDSFEEGLSLANDTRYGLSSAIYTKDLSKALRYAEEIGAGMCHVNGPTIQDEPHIPFGGKGDSGFGREGTDADLQAMTTLKWVTVHVS
ncbi:MAG: aldehyde dehydrogenase family protein [Hyphomonadaceae bacterium]|nr:aldehyde dehydrogenase family protein [Hyphomonadaceae bacterium]